MVNRYTRRNFLKAGVGLGVTAAGAAAGYKVAEKLTQYNPLERIADELYQVTHDTLAEVTGAAEDRLTDSIVKLKTYMGETKLQAEALGKYWDQIGLVEPETFSELEEAIKRSEYYLKEADFGERMTRLKHRLQQQGARIDREVQEKYPDQVRGFNEWFSRMIKGDERGSTQALEKYTVRLDNLVQIYDANRDNVISQADLLDENAGYFAEAQGRVVKQVRTYLADPTLSGVEKEFYRGLIDISESDSSGRDLADYLLKTNGYFRTMGAIDGLEDLSEAIEENTKKIKSLQELMDEGLALKDKVRSTNEVLPQMVTDTRELVTRWEEQREQLRKEGHEVNYDLYPKLKEARDKFVGAVNYGNDIAKYAGAGVGGVLGAYVSGWANWLLNGSDRSFGKRTAKKLDKEEKAHRRTQGELYDTQNALEVSQRELDAHCQELESEREQRGKVETERDSYKAKAEEAERKLSRRELADEQEWMG